MKTTNYSFTAYLTFTSIIGIFIFFYFHDFQFDASSNTVISYALIGAILLLYHYTIPIPPDGNSLSMDSAVYLASLFLFGLDFTLNVLFFNALIFAAYQRKISWWKHLFNFSMYCMMLISSYFMFILLGGKIGSLDTSHLLPYVLSLGLYFLVNSIVICFYFLFQEGGSLFKNFSGIIKDKTFLVSYSCTLLLSIVLGILIKQEGIFGLFLFVLIAMLLSTAFEQNFKLFKDTAEKANKDFLTGLNNHGFFKELFDHEFSLSKKTGQKLCLALIDLDDFKKYNDLYGHIEGDYLLREFGRLLETKAMEKDYIVARYGGEEFSVLMPNTTSMEALTFMNELRKLVNDTHFKGSEALPYGCLSFSAGIAEYEKGTYNASELLKKADDAMYYAKAQGKNLVELYNDESQYLADKTKSFEKQFEKAEQQLIIFISKEVYTYRHSQRVFQYASEFSRKLNLNNHDRKVLTLGALIHDIGKLEIPRDIINKTGKLEPHEWEMMKKHVIWGKEIISTNKNMEELIPLVELHHERYDGKGYPYGLEGDNIPRLARILCIVDSFDAMTTERPYQKTKTFEEAIIELRACAGKQFDPEFVEPFIELIQENYIGKSQKKLVKA